MSVACLLSVPVFLLAGAAGSAASALERVDELTWIDAGTGERFALPCPARPAEVAAGAPRRAAASLGEGYVACFSSNDAYPFDLQSHAVAPAIDLAPEGSYPYDAAINPAETEVWHLGAANDHALVIDRATNAITRRIPVGQYPVGIAFSWDGALAFVSSRDDRRLDIIDTAAYQVVGSLPWPGPVSEEPGKIAVDPVSHLVYVAEWYGPRLYELSADGSAILRSAPVGVDLWAIAIPPDGGHVYLTERDSALNLVRDIERATLSELRTLPVGVSPWGLDVTADGTRLVVACEADDSVWVVDAVGWDATMIQLPTADGPQDLDIHDASGRAYIAAGNEGPIASRQAMVYVIDIPSVTIADRFPVGGYKTSVIAVQGRPGSPLCGTLPAVGPLLAAKLGGDVHLEWPALGAARDGYNVWRVSDRTELPIFSNPPGPSVDAICTPTTATSCDDRGAVAGPAGEQRYYQVKALCGASEGP